MTNLDLDFVRRQFPEKCWEWAFFENAGGSFVPNSVIKRMTDYMTETQVQPGEVYPASAKAQQRMDAGHQKMAELIGADPQETVIAASTSINVYVMAQALRPLWQDGDNIIVTNLNHEANSGPWRRLADTGIKIIEWPVNPDNGQLDLNLLQRLLTDRTRLVAFPHVSNITGEVNDVATITKMAHDAGGEVFVDGVAFAPHRALDLKKWDVDYYVFSFYKIFGPHMGCLYGKHEKLLRARNQYHYFIGEDGLPGKLNPAGPNHESIASLEGIADYFEALASHHLGSGYGDLQSAAAQMFERIQSHEEKLSRMFLEFCDSKPNLKLYGPTDARDRAPTFSFTVDGMKSKNFPALLRDDKIGISSGHFYAKRLVEALGVKDSEDGVVRCSALHYTTVDDMERLITALDRII